MGFSQRQNYFALPVAALDHICILSIVSFPELNILTPFPPADVGVVLELDGCLLLSQPACRDSSARTRLSSYRIRCSALPRS